MAKESYNRQKFVRIGGADIDVNLISQNKVGWKQGECPWNKREDTDKHRCAEKNISICEYFCGIEPWDTVICSYPEKIDHIKIR